MMKHLLLLSMLLVMSTLNSSYAQNINYKWTKETDKATYDAYHTIFSKLNLSELDTRTLVECAYYKTKDKYPSGVNTTVAEFKKARDLICTDCAEAMGYRGIQGWSPINETRMRNYILGSISNEYSSTEKIKLSNCLVTKMKLKYPKGYTFTKVNNTVLDSVLKTYAHGCMDEFKLNLTNWNTPSEATFRAFIINNLGNGLTPKQKSATTDCIVNKLKLQYPAGLSNAIKDSDEYNALILSYFRECMKTVIKSTLKGNL